MAERLVSFSVPEGGNVSITFPEPLSLETITDLEEFTALVFRRLRRVALSDAAAKAGEAEYSSWTYGVATCGNTPYDEGPFTVAAGVKGGDDVR